MKVKKKKYFTTWKTGDFILQFLIVVLGIALTFSISNAASYRSKKKEISSVMQLIKSELELNMTLVDEIYDKFQFENKGSRYILKYKGNIQAADKDSLKRYIGVSFSINSFSYTKDAFDVLKASSLIQYFDNKGQVLDIIKTYNALEELVFLANWYNESKTAHLKEVDKKNQIKINRFLSGNSEQNIYQITKLCLDDYGINSNYVLASFGINYKEKVNRAKENVAKVISMIEQKW